MRYVVSSEGEDRAWRGKIEGEVYLDEIAGLDTPRVEQRIPIESEYRAEEGLPDDRPGRRERRVLPKESRVGGF